MATQLEPRSLATGDGPAYWFLGGLCTLKATTESTAGAYSLMHEIMPPGHTTPYHMHHIEDEAFWVVGGSIAFIADGKKTIRRTRRRHLPAAQNTSRGSRGGFVARRTADSRNARHRLCGDDAGDG